MFRISDAASLALHAGAYLAGREDAPAPAAAMATDLEVSEAHLAKVLGRLARAGLVVGRRGPGGGYVLARPAEEVRLLDLLQAVEGPAQSSPCLLGRAECPWGPCLLGDVLCDLEETFSKRMRGVTLDQVAFDAQPLDAKVGAAGIGAAKARGAKRVDAGLLGA